MTVSSNPRPLFDWLDRNLVDLVVVGSSLLFYASLATFTPVFPLWVRVAMLLGVALAFSLTLIQLVRLAHQQHRP